MKQLQKKNLTALMFAVFASYLFSVQACTTYNDVSPALNAITQSKATEPDLPATWEDKLNYAISGPAATYFAENGVQLVSYAANESINLDSLLASPVSNEALVPTYNDADPYSSNFDVAHVREAKNFTREQFSKRKQQIVSAAGKKILKVVTLNWNYKGEPFKTQCVIAPETEDVLYDDMLSNIAKRKITKPTSTFMLKNGVPSVMSDEEGPVLPPGQHVEYFFVSPTQELISWYGSTLATASCSVTVGGSTTGNASAPISMMTKEMHGSYSSQPGHSADAQVQFTYWYPGTSGHCNFRWAIMVASTASVSISWNGSSFTIPGGASGQLGYKEVIPSMLH